MNLCQTIIEPFVFGSGVKGRIQAFPEDSGGTVSYTA